MIRIIDQPRFKMWEAKFDGRTIAVRAYTEEDKFEMLKECIERAQKAIPYEIELTLPIETVTPI